MALGAVEGLPFVGQVAFDSGLGVGLVFFQCLLVKTRKRGKKTFGEGARESVNVVGENSNLTSSAGEALKFTAAERVCWGVGTLMIHNPFALALRLPSRMTRSWKVTFIDVASKVTSHP